MEIIRPNSTVKSPVLAFRRPVVVVSFLTNAAMHKPKPKSPKMGPKEIEP